MDDLARRRQPGSAVRASVFRFGCGFLGLLLVGCFDLDPEPVPMSYGTITDARDGQVYRTLTVEGMTWMRQDLKFQAPGSICADSTCTLRLYSWSTAMGVDSQFDTTLLGTSSGFRQGVCPAGWHLPTLAEWQYLVDVMSSPGLPVDWATNAEKGFGLIGWDQSGNQTLGWYWVAAEIESGTARYVGLRISYPMSGPQALLWIEQVVPGSKKEKFGIRCLFDEAK